jgi:hypothetical protein
MSAAMSQLSVQMSRLIFLKRNPIPFRITGKPSFRTGFKRAPYNATQEYGNPAKISSPLAL